MAFVHLTVHHHTLDISSLVAMCLLRPIRVAYRRLHPFAQTGPTRRIPTPDLPPRGQVEPRRTVIPLPPVRKTKRKRKDDPVEQFIEWLTEAIDRDEARESIEEELKQIDQRNKVDYKEIEELSCHVEFLEPIAAGEPALERALDKHRNEIARRRAILEKNAEQEELLKRRLAQSTRELAELFRQMYDASDEFLTSADEKGRLRGFYDSRGNLREDVEVPKHLVSGLRMAADCSRLVVSNREKVDKAHKEWMAACNAAKEATSPGQQSRRSKCKSEKFKVWHREEKDYKLQSKLQEQREKDLLTDVVWYFLTTNGLSMKERALSEASSEADVERFRADPQWGSRFHEENTGDGAQRARILQSWLTDRRDLQLQRKQLDRTRQLYDKELVKHLYAYPRSTIADFDAVFRDKTNFDQAKNERELNDAIAVIENEYHATRAAMRADVRNLLLSPYWAGSANDVAPSEASTQAPYLQSPRLDLTRREVRRYGRDVGRRCDPLRNPLTSPKPTSPSSKNSLAPHSGDRCRPFEAPLSITNADFAHNFSNQAFELNCKRVRAAVHALLRPCGSIEAIAGTVGSEVLSMDQRLAVRETGARRPREE